MTVRYRIDASSRIIDDARGVRGRLGAILWDRGGGYPVALAPAQFVGPVGTVRVRSDQGAGFHCTANRLLGDSPDQRAENLLAVIALPRQSSISGVPLPGQGLAGERPIVEPWESLGTDVLIWTSTKEPVRVSVRSAQASFEMKPPGGDRKVCFSRALCMKAGPGEAFLAQDDIGSIVTSESGALLGVIVCGRPDIAYAAPVAELCRKLRLAPFDEASLAQFSASVGRESAMEEFQASYFNQLDHLTEMWRRSMGVLLPSNDDHVSLEEIEQERANARAMLTGG